MAGIFVLAFLIFPVSAFADTQAGEAKTVDDSGALGASRHYMVTTDTTKVNADASDPAGTSDQSFELSAGGSITLKMLEDTSGLNPPDQGTVTFEIREEDTGTLAEGTAGPYTWNPLDEVTFAPTEAGTYRIFIDVDGSFDSDTDNNKGYLRAGTTISESNDARSPAAYDDSVTSTMTLGHTPNSSQSVTMSFRQTGEISNSAPSSATTDFTHNNTIDNTFANSSTAVISRISFNNSALSGLSWTHITALPTGFASVTQTGTGNYTALEKTTAFTADPRLSFSSVTPAETVYNLGETASTTFKLLNVQSEELTKSISWNVRDSEGNVKTTPSLTDTGPIYGDGADDGYSLGGDDDAVNTTDGKQWDIITNISDAHDISIDTYNVSSLLRISTLSNGTIDNNTQSFSDSGYTNSATVFNRNETVYNQFYLYGARGQLITDNSSIGTDLTLQVRDSSNTEGSPVPVSADANGLVQWDYTVGTGDDADNNTSGSAKNFTLTKTGNSLYQGSGGTEGSGSEWNVSSLYFIDAHPELDDTLNKDDWETEDDNETLTGVIAAEVFSFFAHVKNVRKDTNIDTAANEVEFTVKKPDGTTEATNLSQTGSDGWTNNYDFSLIAPAGSWTVTASTTANGNFGTDTETLTFVSPYTGNYQMETVGWNQTYDIGDTARFTIRTLQRNSAGTFVATAADSAPTYDLRYWDGATWQELASSSMSSLDATATYETTYAIPNDSAWIGRKITVNFSTVMSGTRINETREIEVVGSPAQVVINSMADTTIPTISADVRITNEGTAAFEYTYEWCVVTAGTNECGGGNDAAYGSAAKLIQAGANFDTTLTLNVTDTGSYIFKVAVWWSNQSSKASRTFTATSATSDDDDNSSGGEGGGKSSSSGGGGGGTITPAPQSTEQRNTFAAVWQKIAEILSRIIGIENRVNTLEGRVAALEQQRSTSPAPTPQPAPRREIYVPQPHPSAPKVEAQKERFKIRLE